MARYTITHKGEKDPVNYPGVTTITGLLDKSRVLMSWAVKMMLLWLHKNWINFVTEESKKGFFVEFEEKEDYFKMLEEAKDHYMEVSDEAKEIGIQVHDLAHEYINARINNKKFVLPTKLKKESVKRFLAVVEWFKRNVVKFIETEQPICSKKYGFCGTFDILARLKPCDEKDNKIKGGLYIVDLKSSKDFYDGQAKQAAGYKIGRQEGGRFHLLFKNDNDKENIETWEKDIDIKPIQIDGIGILTTNYKDTGQSRFKDYTDKCEIKETAFLKLLDFYYNDKNRMLKNNPFTLKGRTSNQKKGDPFS